MYWERKGKNEHLEVGLRCQDMWKLVHERNSSPSTNQLELHKNDSNSVNTSKPKEL